MDHSFSNRLLLTPLFQGFSRLDFLDIVEKTPLEFQTFQPGDIIIRQEQPCQNLGLLLGGNAWFMQSDPEQTYRYAELIPAPFIVQPESLFGLHNRYTRTVTAATELQVVILSKQSVNRLMHEHITFQLNLLNNICSEAQHRGQLMWQKRLDSPDERFRIFLLRRSLRPAGHKVLRIRMEDLACELGTTRLKVSNMLRHLSHKGLLTYSRGTIDIPRLELF